MKMLIAYAREKKLIEYDGDMHGAKKIAELEGVDHGTVAEGIGIVVYEFGLFDPPEEQHYIGIGRTLVAGNAILYGYREDGASRDLREDQLPPIIWFKDAGVVEDAIRHGVIDRPVMAVNGEVFWQWPEPREKPRKEVVG